MEETVGRLARWRLDIVEFELDFVHWAVVKHRAAGALPRMSIDGTDMTRLNMRSIRSDRLDLEYQR